MKTFDEAACVIVKHANPCGVAVAAGILDAYKHAYITDPTSAFGGIIAFNRPVDAATLEAVCAQFVEVLIAPAFAADALDFLGVFGILREFSRQSKDPRKAYENTQKRMKKLPGMLCLEPSRQIAAGRVKEMEQPDTAAAYLQKYCYGVRSHEEYMDLVGRDRLADLRYDKGGKR